MAASSQQVTWKLLGGKRPCSGCGRDITLEELTEVRRDLGGPLLVWCFPCSTPGRERAKKEAA